MFGGTKNLIKTADYYPHKYCYDCSTPFHPGERKAPIFIGWFTFF